MTLLRQLTLIGLAVWGLHGSANAQFLQKQAPTLLPEAQAFTVSHSATTTGLTIDWSIANDYYLYRDQFGASVDDGETSFELELEFLSKGVIELDPEFGNVEVFFFNTPIRARFPADFTPRAGQTYNVVLRGQGCNKPVGVCYPPMQRKVQATWSDELLAQAPSAEADLPAATVLSEPTTGADGAANQTDNKQPKSFWAYVLSAFGAGLLLSLTPCVLPMVPILSGIIAKQQSPSRWSAGWLSIVYVAGTIVTYVIAGWIAGATGTQLQAYFQNPWVIGFICTLLILLAASLFGLFHIASPSGLHARLHQPPLGATPGEASAGSNVLLSFKSFGLGLTSALVVGACVSPILILALGAAIKQGDPVLGAAIMGAMAAGMGLLLIVFGFGAGWLLPKTGAWMEQVQAFFGFMVLGVAIYIAGALTIVPILLLWALLLLVFGFYVWQLANVDSATERPGLAASLGKAIGFAALLWGCLALIGYASGGRQILSPLSELSFNSSNAVEVQLPFETTTTLEQTSAILAQAKAAEQPVLIDFYADWCFDCVRMKRTTFKSPEVAAALNGWRLVVVDVTDTSPASETVKRHFNVFGPPATLMIAASGEERLDLRQYGYMQADEFIAKVQSVN